jgi:5-methylcytosine-specific restriction protein A
MPSKPPTLRQPWQKPREQAEVERKKAIDARRSNSAERGYGHRWRVTRKGYLQKHPLCVACEKKGRVEPATDLDHIIPHRGDMELFWDRSNWQGLCETCHSTKTATEDSSFANRRHAKTA